MAITGSDGSTVIAAGTDADEAETLRTIDIDAQEVDLLTATWIGENATAVTLIDVVGGVYFTVAELRANEKAVINPDDYPIADIQSKRQIAETIFEQPSKTSFVPRFYVLVPSERFASQQGIRSVRWVEFTDGSFETDSDDILNSVEIANEGIYVSRSVKRVGVVVGFDVPPPDVWRASMRYVRHMLTEGTTNMDMRVMASSLPDGQIQQFATPGLSLWVTGLPEIDEVIKRYREPAMVRSIRPRTWFA